MPKFQLRLKRVSNFSLPFHCQSECWSPLLKGSLWTESYDVTIQMKATEQYFPVVLFIMLYKVVLTFESVNKIL